MEIWVGVFMYLLGVMLVLGLVEPVDDEHENAPVKLALTWPIVSVMYIWAMLMDFYYGDER